MKRLLYSILLCCSVLAFSTVQAQSKTTTIIVLRHAEKDTSKAGSQMMQADPPLSEAGKTRAQNLVNTLEGYKVNAIYSTNYNRTRSTVTPLSEKYRLHIELYDPRTQQALAEQLKRLEGKTVVVAGHSNTAPQLVNALAGTAYPDLHDSIYDQLYIITIKDGVAKVELKKY